MIVKLKFCLCQNSNYDEVIDGSGAFITANVLKKLTLSRKLNSENENTLIYVVEDNTGY